MRRLWWIVVVASGCATSSGEIDDCVAVCDELVRACAVAAYPSETSCQEGCLWEQTQGADLPAYRACVEEAECASFAIVDCQRTYGAP